MGQIFCSTIFANSLCRESNQPMRTLFLPSASQTNFFQLLKHAMSLSLEGWTPVLGNGVPEVEETRMPVTELIRTVSTWILMPCTLLSRLGELLRNAGENQILVEFQHKSRIYLLSSIWHAWPLILLKYVVDEIKRSYSDVCLENSTFNDNGPFVEAFLCNSNFFSLSFVRHICRYDKGKSAPKIIPKIKEKLASISSRNFLAL